MNSSTNFLRRVAALALLPLLSVPPSFGWGNDGHRMINRLAAEGLSPDVPAFLRSPAAISEIEYLGPEPDRWRSPAEPELSGAQAPDHFIDLEIADTIGPLPRRRYDYIAALYAAAAAHADQAHDLRPERVGFQPYITSEVYERLKAAMREYRGLLSRHEDTKPVEQAIVFYVGWLGHYVADGSQPLHVTVNYDGWVGKENPKGYSTQRGLHEQFESTFVSANLKAADVRPLISAPHAIGDKFADYISYLRHSASLMERLYELDKAHAFDGRGTPEGRQFTAERLAAGASMLRDMIESAWVESAKAVPEWHPAPKKEGAAPGKVTS
jgi:hypothetical protein